MSNSQAPAPNKFNLSLDLRMVVMLLLAVIAGMLLVWKPWDGPTGANARTVEVTGDATVKAEPDEYVFNPRYEYKNTDKAVALAATTKKSSEVVAKLKTLGVEDSQIKTNTGSFDWGYAYDAPTKSNIYTLQVTVTLGSRQAAQKVQDYLVTTTPIGSVSPQAQFSDAKRKQLESQARDNATKEARSKAEQSAKNLGFKIGKVKSVNDGAGFARPYAIDSKADVQMSAPEVDLAVQPGQNDLNYTVTVVYYLR